MKVKVRRGSTNAYVKANALNAMAAKQAATPVQQPQIIFTPTPQMSAKEQKKIEAKGEWGVNDIDDILVVEATSQTSGKPFIF